MTPDIADIIAGELKVSRGTAYDLMREALRGVESQQEPDYANIWHKAWPDEGAFVRASAEDLKKFAKALAARGIVPAIDPNLAGAQVQESTDMTIQLPEGALGANVYRNGGPAKFYPVQPTAPVQQPAGYNNMLRRVRATLKQCEIGFTGSIGSVLEDVEAMLTAPAQVLQRYSPDGEGGMEVDSLGAYVKHQDVTIQTAAQPAPVEPTEDSEIKDAYITAHGTDDGWLGVEGSYFTSGYQAWKRTTLKSSQPGSTNGKGQEPSLAELGAMIASASEGSVTRGAYNRLRDDYNDIVDRSNQDAKDAKQWRAHVKHCQLHGVDLDYQVSDSLPSGNTSAVGMLAKTAPAPSR